MMLIGQAARIAAAALMALVLAVAIGALVPRNPGWAEPEAGITIGIDATIAHTELILPVAAAGHDWRPVLRRGTALGTGIVPINTRYLAFSWGDGDFFRATPTWAEFRLHGAIRALFHSRGSLMHVTRLEGPHGRPIRLTPHAYRRLVAAIEAELGPGPALPGYGPDDIFLPSTTRYSALRTCNDWAADMLAAAGVRVGLWTPLAQTLIWRFADGPA